MHSALEAAKRLRPRRAVKVLGEKFNVRMPSMADIRVFQEKRGEDSRGALAGFLQTCVLGKDDAEMTTEEAGELADCQWLSQPLLTKIMGFATGHTEEGEPEAGAGKEPGGESSAPPAVAG